MMTHNQFNEILKPYCAVCNKLVDLMECADDWSTRELVVKVSCHGETDTCRLNDEFRSYAQIERGIAFHKPKEIEKLLPSISELNQMMVKELEKLK